LPIVTHRVKRTYYFGFGYLCAYDSDCFTRTTFLLVGSEHESGALIPRFSFLS